MTTDDTTQQLPPESPRPRRLLRTRSDRVIGGVCGGLGRYFNLDPIIFRIGAVVLAFIGGAGLLAYLAALLLIPSEDSPAAADAPPGRNRWLVIAIGGAWAAAAGGETVVAITVIAAGVAILVGAFVRPVRFLVLPAVTLALSAGAVSAAGIDLDGGIGERDYRPASAADLRDTYQLGMGELVVDLRQTDLPSGDVPVAIDLGIGEARLIVPEDVCVATDAQVGIGEARTFDRHNDGVDVDVDDLPDASADTTRLLVKADVGIGSLRIGRSGADLDLDHDHFDFGPGFRDDLGRNSACDA